MCVCVCVRVTCERMCVEIYVVVMLLIFIKRVKSWNRMGDWMDEIRHWHVQEPGMICHNVLNTMYIDIYA